MHQTVALAIKSQAEEVDVEERARKFREKYVGKLRTLLVNPW